MKDFDTSTALILLAIGLVSGWILTYSLVPCIEECSYGNVTGSCTDLLNAQNSQFMSFNTSEPIECDQKNTQVIQLKTPDVVCPEPIVTNHTCPDCICSCEVCTKCPTCEYEFSMEEVFWWKNECRIRKGSSAYQSGSADTCDIAADYFEIPGYPKFRTRPSTSGNVALMYSQGVVVDKNPEQFTFNTFTEYGRRCFTLKQFPDENDRPRWSWDKEECAGSELKICHI